jgi:PIN domain nuclease of toxin-antitoxin system
VEGLSPVVFDASAIIAALKGEPGEDRVREAATRGSISTVNLSEVVAYFARRGHTARDSIVALLGPLPVGIVPFDTDHAMLAGLLVVETRSIGLSLGDRACLALARARSARIFTSDRAWSRLPPALGFDIVLIR